MSAYSTLYITRTRALAVLLERALGGITDEQLENFVDKILEPRLYNCRVVSDDHEHNDDHEL